MQVKDFLFRDLTSVSENTSVKQLIKIMIYHHTTSVPIVNEHNAYVGCISEADIFDACTPPYMKLMKNTAFLPNINHICETLQATSSHKVKDLMPPDYPTIKPEDSIMYAVDIMNKSNREILPVVENGKLIGTLSRVELLSVVLKNMS